MKRYTWRTGVLEIVMIAVGVIFMLPLYVLINLSFKKEGDLSQPLTPGAPTFENYVNAWNDANLGSAILYTATITVVSVTLLVFLSALAAYPIARATSRWGSVAFFTFLIGLLLPLQLALFPLYTTMRDLGLLNTVWALVVYSVGIHMPFSVFLYTGFLRVVPAEFEEAAIIDGANVWTTFWRVVFPLARPVTGTVIILNAIGIWNDFLVPLLYLSGSDQQTIPVALYAFLGQFQSRWQLVFAGLVIGIIPVLVVYFLLQRYIIKGFAGGLKG